MLIEIRFTINLVRIVSEICLEAWKSPEATSGEPTETGNKVIYTLFENWTHSFPSPYCVCIRTQIELKRS